MLVIGAITALSMGLVALTQFDIKRVVAYSTLSQLGYMTAALGASAYSAAMFHLMTHAFFKAVLFLAAGSVIIALHHEQDMRRMGGLKKHMPLDLLDAADRRDLVGRHPAASPASISKDAIIEAVQHSTHAGRTASPTCACSSCVFVTATYTFRLVFMAFHGEERFDAAHPPHESPAVVTVPLVLLAIPSVIAGLAGRPGGVRRLLRLRACVAESRGVARHLGLHGCTASWRWPFWLAVAGIVTACVLYMKRTRPAEAHRHRLRPARTRWSSASTASTSSIRGCSPAARARARHAASGSGGDQTVIDGLMVNGSARAGRLVLGRGPAAADRPGELPYAFLMLFGVLSGMSWVVWRFWHG